MPQPNNNDTSSQVRTLLTQASELPAGERETFLDQACRGDDAVRAEVQALLSMLEHADDFLNRFPADQAPSDASSTGLLDRGPEDALAASPPSPDSSASSATDPAWIPAAAYAPGTVIKHYTLLNVLGEGGFGRVYLAEQRHPVARQVALKIIKPGMDTRQVVARFRAERQALALMDHPNIAKVLDAGSTDDGRPFIVMELVRGVPITEYCDAVSLGLRDRLALFIQVCNAVQHAHQKGIIHRDLKPSNVLVTLADARPIPKVIDFGVAKAIAPAGNMTTLTGDRQWMGTPQYMSPEQAGVGSDIDTRADIYSLGVLLYELLTGSTPFDTRDVREATPQELQRMVAQVEPRRPSTRVIAAHGAAVASQTLSAGAAAASRMGIEPRKLGQMLRGELDWIVMKSLEKDRTRRYATANALVSDVNRYLRGEPVTAGPPSRTYRLRKLVMRNRALITAAALVLAALLLGTIGTAIGLVRARSATAAAIGQRDAAAHSESLAREETARAAGLSSFLQQMLSSADTQHTKGKALLVSDVLEGASRQLEQNPPADKQTAEAIHHTLGVTYQSLGLYGRASTHFESAMKLREQMFGPDHIEVARCMAELAEALWSDNRYAAAEPWYHRSLEIRKQRLGEESAEVAAEMVRVGNMYQGKGQWDDADRMYLRSLEIRRKLFGEDNLATAESLLGLAIFRRDQGNKEEAGKLAEEALRIRRKLLPPDDPLIAESLKVVGGIPNTREALAIQKRSLGPDHPEVARTSMTLALAMIGVSNDFGPEPEALLNDAVRIAKKAYGDEHGEVARIVHIRGRLYAGRKDWPRAEADYRLAMELYRRLIGEDSPELGWAVRDTLPVFEEQHKYAAAEDMLLKRYEWSKGKTEARFSKEVADMLVELYTKWEKPEKAAEWRAIAGPAAATVAH